MKGTCPECGERTTFSRVDELEDEDVIKEGIEMLNSLTGDNDDPPEAICDSCGVGVDIHEII